MARSDEQINIRISADQYTALAAAAFVDGLKSPSELVRPWIEKLARDLANDPAVAMAIEARVLRQEQSGDKVADLSMHRARSLSDRAE